jgi:hypothetical protein
MNRVIALTMAGVVLLFVGCSKKEQQAAAPAAKAAQQAVAPPPKAAPVFLRDHYAKLEDCVYDWGYPQKCMPVPPGSPVAQSGAGFLGPIYKVVSRGTQASCARKRSKAATCACCGARRQSIAVSQVLTAVRFLCVAWRARIDDALT